MIPGTSSIGLMVGRINSERSMAKVLESSQFIQLFVVNFKFEAESSGSGNLKV